jgi:alpha-L-fucosidase
MKLFTPLAIVLISRPGLAAEPSGNPDTDWLMESRCGVFMHFLPADARGLAQVEEFDVPALVRQLESAGAKYFVITLGQNSGFFISPNAAYDKRTGYAAGERCARRDLPLDIARELKPKGIRLMLYLPAQTPNQDRRAQKAFGIAEGPADQPIDLEFAKKWAEVIAEWSTRYKDQVAGWWFDGCYEWVRFNEEIAKVYRPAVRRGNPHAIVAFNPGVRVIHYMASEDYTAGELNEPLEVIPASRWLDGSQWHALTYLGSNWGKRDTRYPAERWAEWVKKVVARGGAVTLDMGPNWDPKAGPIGALVEKQLDQVKAIAAALRQLPGKP